MKEIEQEKWVSFQSGDKNSFAWLYDTYVDDLYNYGIRFIADTHLVEDTIQDLFIRLWKNKRGLKVPPSVKNYLFTAFRNLLFRTLSRQKKFLSMIWQKDVIPFYGNCPLSRV